MQIIQHRVNDVQALQDVSKHFGAEVDIRYHDDRLVLAHDPFHAGKAQDFESWLERYDLQGPLILNVKTEGVEMRCIELMRRFNIKDYFFLDLSMPYFVQYTAKAAAGEIDGFSPANLAVRYSEAEPLAYALAFEGKARWVWVDCFSRLPLDAAVVSALKAAGFKTCLVSPELQKHDTTRIVEFRAQLAQLDHAPDAVCTKRPDLWSAA